MMVSTRIKYKQVLLLSWVYFYRSENVMNEKLLKEKEQVIAELLEEGNKAENLFICILVTKFWCLEKRSTEDCNS